MKKKIIYNEKTKFFWSRNFNGLQPSLYCERKRKKNYIARIVQVWLQYKIVLQVRRLVYGFLCCNTVVCIAEIKAG